MGILGRRCHRRKINFSTATSSNYQTAAHIRVRGDDEQRIIEAISLVKKVGFSGDVSQQFEDLCGLTGLNPTDARRRAKALKDSPGFVAIGGRFFYITPEAIAQVALRNAWRHWIEDAPDRFFARIPESLWGEFQARVAHSGDAKSRNALAQYSHRWLASLLPTALGDKKRVDRLVALLDTSPSDFLPTLVRLVEQATADELRDGSEWGARRSLVWLCERLSLFPDYFHDIERVLFRLALHESEEGIGNNATAIWTQLFRMLLSGSSLPYGDRLQLLDGRLFAESPEEAALALDALGGIFADHASRVLGPAVVAGRIPPPDWCPTTNGEEGDCFNAAFDLYERIIGRGSANLRERAVKVLVGHISWFLRHGMLDTIRRLLPPPRIPLSSVPKALEEIDLCLELRSEQSHSEGYLENMRAWRASLVPSDLHSRLVSLVGRESYHWREREAETEWRMQMGALAAELVADHQVLRGELEWLTSIDAKSAGELGEEIAKQDPSAELFDVVLAKAGPNLSLNHGYVFGLVRSHPEHVPRLNSFLEKLERDDARLAFEYSANVPKETDALGRWARLCDAGLIPTSFVRGVVYRLGRADLTNEQLKQALDRLIVEAGSSEPEVSETALELVHARLGRKTAQSSRPQKDDHDLWRRISRVLGEVLPRGTMGTYYWEESLNAYSEVNPADAAKIAASRLTDQTLSVDEAAERVLGRMAEGDPDLVMRELGKTLLADQGAWRLRIRGCGSVLLSLPPETVLAWLDVAQVEGARKIASSLEPAPEVG